jgi:hypothetical protein
MDEFLLSEEQESEAREIEDLLKAKMAVEAQRIARMLASKPNAELFGALEFQVRERVHALGAQAIEAALHERKKRGIKGRA